MYYNCKYRLMSIALKKKYNENVYIDTGVEIDIKFQIKYFIIERITFVFFFELLFM